MFQDACKQSPSPAAAPSRTVGVMARTSCGMSMKQRKGRNVEAEEYVCVRQAPPFIRMRETGEKEEEEEEERRRSDKTE